ncbi:ABC transporter ATP-binding protein [Desulfurispora thermophila]|uniref:ABC transporter ATP-binding protein n=1 Tax=Desulfurispora thermophila TaxID=265470 RepID=UPI0003816FCA|nr:ABC transporter ATP-binding protein [Desulfurispora thermophila]
MIKIEGLRKSFGRTVALDDMDLRVPPGCIMGLVGPNGAGKTTAMSILATLLPADGGRALVAGYDAALQPGQVRSLIGYMPDFFGVYDGLTCEEYLNFFADAMGLPGSGREGLIANLLELVNLAEKRGEYVDLLSRGMKQRLALARCLVHDPEVLILDEPASGLDPRARAELKAIIRQLKEMGKTVLISSHILPELAQICDQVAIMEKGRVIAAGPVEEITALQDGSQLVQMEVLENVEQVVRYLQEAGAVQVRLEGEKVTFAWRGGQQGLSGLLRQLVQAGFPVLSFAPQRRDLEETFMAVTREGDEHGR